MPRPGETKQETELRLLRSALIELLHRVGLIKTEAVELTTKDLIDRVQMCEWFYKDGGLLYGTPHYEESEIPF